MDSIKCLNSAIAGLIGIGTMWMSHAAYAAPAADPCSLLTPAQVGAALGATVGAGNRIASTLCIWGAPPKRVTLTLHQPQEFEALKMPVGNAVTKIAVGGIGDEAVSGTSKIATTLSVKKGGVVFVVTVGGFPEEQTKAMEKALALDVLARL
jgi:hypothetical protein